MRQAYGDIIRPCTVVIDRRVAHSWQNRGGGGDGDADERSGEVQHDDEESDDMDAKADGNVADQSSGNVLAQVQPEGGHHPDNLGALALQGRQKRPDRVLAGRCDVGRLKFAVCDRQSGWHGRFLGS